MTHRKGAIWTERLLLGLIVFSLGATLSLLLATHRQSGEHQAKADLDSNPTHDSAPAAIASAAPKLSAPAALLPNSVNSPVAANSPKSPDPPESLPPPEDPTKKGLAALGAAATREIEAADAADRRALVLEAGRNATIAEAQKWKRRELLVRQQIAGLTERAERLERDANVLDAERDVLAHERDALKAALFKASRRSGFAVLPYKGANGTWRRPIVLECNAEGVKLQPHGPTFSTLEISPRLHPRSSAFVLAIERELLHIRTADTPDGAPAVPYFVFLVRPDGIRSYYLVRNCLEPSGIAFGYELVEQELPVDIPDFDDLTTWDGSVPLEMPLAPAPQTKSAVAMVSPDDRYRDGSSSGSLRWPRNEQGSLGGGSAGSIGRGQQEGAGSSTPENANPEDFVWPSRSRGNRPEGTSGPGASTAGQNGNQTTGSDTGTTAQEPGSDSLGSQAGSASSGILGGRTSSSGETLGASGGTGSSAGMGRFPSPGTGSSLFTRGSANGQELDQKTPGSVSGLAEGGDLKVVPDLEPAGDGASARSLPPSGGASPGAAPVVSSGAGGPSGDLSPGQAGFAVPSGNSGGDGTSSPPLSAGGGASPGALPFASTGAGSPRGGLSPGRAGMTVPSDSGAFSSSSNSGGGRSAAVGSGLTGAGMLPLGGPGSGGVPSGVGEVQGGAANQAELGAPVSGNLSSTGAIPSGGGQLPGALATQPGAGTSSQVKTSTVAIASNPAGQLADLDSSGQTAGGTPGNLGSFASAFDSTKQSSVGPFERFSADAQGSQNDQSAGGLVSSASAQVSQPQGSNLSGTSSASGSVTNSGVGMPWSSSSSTSSSSNSSPGGMPLGSPSSSNSPTSSGSNLSFGQDGASSSDSSTEWIVPPRPREIAKMGSIEVPFEIVVVCRSSEVVLHPGGYRLTTRAMREKGRGDDCLLAREIRAMVRKRAIIDPLIRPRPAIKFLVETNGAGTFEIARRQLLFSLPDWPVSLQVAGSQEPHVFSKESW